MQPAFCRFPATFTFVLRAFSTLEGIGRALDPDYKFVAVAQPYAQQLLNLQVRYSKHFLVMACCAAGQHILCPCKCLYIDRLDTLQCKGEKLI